MLLVTTRAEPRSRLVPSEPVSGEGQVCSHDGEGRAGESHQLNPVLGDAAAFSGVSRYPARVKCAMLAWVALEESLLAANA